MMVTAAELVIVGFGPAAHRLLQELATQSALPASIVVLGEESEAAYNRIMLSPYLAGELSADALTLEVPRQLHDRLQILTDHRVCRIDRDGQTVVCENGAEIHYQQLVLATGSRASLPAMVGVEASGVMGFRNFRDVAKMRAQARRGGCAVVVGGGLLGLEAAEGLRKNGMQVVVLHRSGHLLNRQLDSVAASLLRRELSTRGCRIETSITIETIEVEQRHVVAVSLSNGERLACDLLVFAVGIKPNDDIARQAGLDVGRAVCVDAQMRTSDPHIFALGECCQFLHHTYGLVAPIWRQASVLAATLCGEQAEYTEEPVATQLKVSGIELFSCGDVPATPPSYYYLDSVLGDYRALWLVDGRIESAVMYGDVTLGSWYFEQIQGQSDVSALGDQILFANLLAESSPLAA